MEKNQIRRVLRGVCQGVLSVVATAMVMTGCATGGNSGNGGAEAAKVDPLTPEGAMEAVRSIYADVFATYEKKKDVESALGLIRKHGTEGLAEEMTAYYGAHGELEPWFSIFDEENEKFDIKIDEPKLENMKVQTLTTVPDKYADVRFEVKVNGVMREMSVDLVIPEGVEDEWQVRDILWLDAGKTVTELADKWLDEVDYSEGGEYNRDLRELVDGEEYEGDEVYYSEDDVVEVSSAMDLARAIQQHAKNIKIFGRINLSSINYEEAPYLFGDYSTLDEDSPEGLYYGSDAIYFNKISGLNIMGSGNDAEILTQNADCTVLSFIGCNDLTLENLWIGHDVTGSCDSGVLGLVDCKGVSINRCQLYGCGTDAINAINCEGMEVSNTLMDHCSDAAFWIQDCMVKFTHCEFMGIGGQLFNAATEECAGSDITLEDCYIHDNAYNYGEGPVTSTLFAFAIPVKMKNCVIHHPKGAIGDISQVKDEGCKWNDTLQGERIEDIGTRK
jgi:hypothetical protein